MIDCSYNISEYGFIVGIIYDIINENSKNTNYGLTYDDINSLSIENDPHNARGGTELNSQEKDLILSYPAQGLLYVVISEGARVSAHEKYTDFSCWYDGKVFNMKKKLIIIILLIR